MAAVIVLLGGCSGNTQAGETEAPAQTSGNETESGDTFGDIDPNGHLAKILKSGKLVQGVSPDYAPWEFTDTSSGTTEYVGADIELAKYIAEQLGVELEIHPMEFSAILQAVSSGTVDVGISGFAWTEERAEAMELSDLYNNDVKGSSILVRKDEADQFKSAEAFAGKRIAVQNASVQQGLVGEELPADVSVQLVSSISDGAMMLVNGKVDAVAVTALNGQTITEAYPEIAVAPWTFESEKTGNVIVLKKGDTEFMDVINEILKDVNEQGLYEKWREDATALQEKLGV